MAAFKNTKTNKELEELFDKIVNRLKIFKKLIQCLILLRKKE